MNIAILTCYANTQELACSSFRCLQDLYEGKGTFSIHRGKAKLVGITNCGGCATIAAPEKLLKRVRSLTELQPDVIHLSNCMLNLCPFVNKNAKLLANHFPHIRFIKGTHLAPAGLSDAEAKHFHRALVKDMVVQGKTVADLIPVLYQPSDRSQDG